MTWTLLSTLLIILIPIILIIYDLVTYIKAGDGATFSKIFLKTSTHHPWFLIMTCFLIGVLCGHVFVPKVDPSSSLQVTYIILFFIMPLLGSFYALISTLIGYNYVIIKILNSLILKYRMIFVLISLTNGVLIGHYLVGQHF
jgi:hypothetical protein